MNLITRTWFLMPIIPLLVASCGPENSREATGSDTIPTVYTVNYPLAYFARRIRQEQVKVVFPAPPDVDPAFWNPDPETIVAYQEADLIQQLPVDGDPAVGVDVDDHSDSRCMPQLIH